jgi:CheY-like chemotaxis protein
VLSYQKGEDRRSRILIVDDHEDSRMVARIVLEHDGHEVFQAATGTEALRMACELLPDVILMDIVLPELDGLEASQRIRRHPKATHTRIVAMTALDRGTIYDEALLAGCNAFLPKPFHIAALRKVVHDQLHAASRLALISVLGDFATMAKASIRHRTTKGQYLHP